MHLIIGWGNSLRGDDCLGLKVAELLEAQQIKAVICKSHQLLPEMSEEISRADQVIFVDASLTVAPGQMAVSELCAEEGDSSPDSHKLSPQILLNMARHLYGKAPVALVYALGGYKYEGETMSPALEPLVAEAAASIAASIATATRTSLRESSADP